jgi:hypothetical protein
MTTTLTRETTKRQLYREAIRLQGLARAAHESGDLDLRDSRLVSARERYRQGGFTASVAWCDRFIGTTRAPE